MINNNFNYNIPATSHSYWPIVNINMPTIMSHCLIHAPHGVTQLLNGKKCNERKSKNRMKEQQRNK